ncbi:hypothetical protein EJ05DRAFT_334996 [Pseudovirgaria hyperparasitica]|uniref:Uncharacterized protein n=1 Tax=Pseudovirgaria hyperparasitica TaxID=470096 RepID=A0A6A6WAF8_9PEZI|nr:uncharacterized protein EJ05DRAFT_334996 [Pseudovirgaria hyperparasitica]KAF2759159.1 hypothetical protein EJ05DRAFT_334996 [Pseudovirgaria hyperparasitica]
MERQVSLQATGGQQACETKQVTLLCVWFDAVQALGQLTLVAGLAAKQDQVVMKYSRVRTVLERARVVVLCKVSSADESFAVVRRRSEGNVEMPDARTFEGGGRLVNEGTRERGDVGGRPDDETTLWLMINTYGEGRDVFVAVLLPAEMGWLEQC